jgi:hypothetical protein
MAAMKSVSIREIRVQFATVRLASGGEQHPAPEHVGFRKRLDQTGPPAARAMMVP